MTKKRSNCKRNWQVFNLLHKGLKDTLIDFMNSLTGKKLLAKCKLLQEENEEFGLQLSEDKFHKLENELALQKELTEELKKGLVESNEFVVQLDDEVETMQNEILSLKQQLKLATKLGGTALKSEELQS